MYIHKGMKGMNHMTYLAHYLSTVYPKTTSFWCRLILIFNTNSFLGSVLGVVSQFQVRTEAGNELLPYLISNDSLENWRLPEKPFHRQSHQSGRHRGNRNEGSWFRTGPGITAAGAVIGLTLNFFHDKIRILAVRSDQEHNFLLIFSQKINEPLSVKHLLLPFLLTKIEFVPALGPLRAF